MITTIHQNEFQMGSLVKRMLSQKEDESKWELLSFFPLQQNILPSTEVTEK